MEHQPDTNDREEFEAPVHPPTQFNAGDGQGTSKGAPKDQETLERPVMDGASESHATESQTENPRRGMSDPGLVRRPETGEKTPTPDEEK